MNNEAVNTYLNKTALITGATSGIGEAFARSLASRRCNLILVARRLEKLQQLSYELSNSNGISVETIQADLSATSDVQLLEEHIASAERIDLVINSAGFVTASDVLHSDVNKQVEMVNVHLTTPCRIIRSALPGMIRRNSGGIINVASIGAFIWSSHNAMYSATKTGLYVFSKVLRKELQGTNIKVQVLCPGFTKTNIYNNDDFHGGESIRKAIPAFMWTTADKVVTQSLKDLEKNKFLSIPGIANKILIGVSPLLGDLLAESTTRRIQYE